MGEEIGEYGVDCWSRLANTVCLPCPGTLIRLSYRILILIRYGDASPTTPGSQHSLLRTLTIPSPLLKKHNLEIVISSLSSDIPPNQTHSLKYTVLVPFLEMPVSANGRFSAITYPVHKALIF